MVSRRRLLELARQILDTPTASFHEHRVLRLLAQHAGRLALPAAQDRWGNLHVRYRGAARQRTWVLIAHADHPGFVVTRAERRRVSARWFGSVEPHYFRDARVAIYPEQGRAVRGRICAARRGPRGRIAWLAIQAEAPVPVGAIGTWDLPGFRLRGDRLSARAADDLIGCTVLAALLEALVRGRRAASVEVIYTRAEEAGLLGSTALARSRTLSPSDPVLVLETSRELPCGRIGAGPVLRVGDRLSAFDPGLARWMQETAADLQKRHRGLRTQRGLMDGGVCEATPFGASGYRATGLAIPLGNYHNMAPKRIAAEQVDVGDLLGALRLLEALVTRPWRGAGWPAVTDERLLRSWLAPHESALRRSVTRPLQPWPERG
jgi:putative aminopeptidase FrvX